MAQPTPTPTPALSDEECEINQEKIPEPNPLCNIPILGVQKDAQCESMGMRTNEQGQCEDFKMFGDNIGVAVGGEGGNGGSGGSSEDNTNIDDSGNGGSGGDSEQEHSQSQSNEPKHEQEHEGSGESNE